MKTIVKLLLFILLVTTISSCEKEQKYDILLLSKVYVDDELRQTHHYNNNDLLDYIEYYYDTKITSKAIFFYNSANNISKIEFMNEEGETTNEVHYNYNSGNQLIESINYSFRDYNTNINKIRYSYNEIGQLTADTFIFESGKINYYRVFEPVNSKSYKTSFYSYNGKLSGSLSYEFDRDISKKPYSLKFMEPDNCTKMSSDNEIEGNAIFEFEIDDNQSDTPFTHMVIIPLYSSSYAYNKSGYPIKKYTVANSPPSETNIITYEYIIPKK